MAWHSFSKWRTASVKYENQNKSYTDQSYCPHFIRVSLNDQILTAAGLEAGMLYVCQFTKKRRNPVIHVMNTVQHTLQRYLPSTCHSEVCMVGY